MLSVISITRLLSKPDTSTEDVLSAVWKVNTETITSSLVHLRGYPPPFQWWVTGVDPQLYIFTHESSQSSRLIMGDPSWILRQNPGSLPIIISCYHVKHKNNVRLILPPLSHHSFYCTGTFRLCCQYRRLPPVSPTPFLCRSMNCRQFSRSREDRITGGGRSLKGKGRPNISSPTKVSHY